MRSWGTSPTPEPVRYLLVPALTEPPAAAHENSPRESGAVQRVLRRGDRVPAPSGLAANLLALAGYAVPDQHDAPSAAIHYLGESGESPEHYLFHADPVQLRVDLTRITAHALRPGSLGESDAQAYLSAFNTHFALSGIALIAMPSGRWYLCVASADPVLRTADLTEIAGRSLDPFMPRGRDAAHWATLLNEVQMLFHDLPVTAEREAAGRVSVGGIWLWGGGRLPRVSDGRLRLEGDSPLVAGLRHLGVDPGAADDGASPVVEVHERLEAATRTGDVEGWDAAFAQIDARVADLMATEFVLMPCDGFAYRWRPTMRWRFWR